MVLSRGQFGGQGFFDLKATDRHPSTIQPALVAAFPPTEDVLRGLFWVGYYHAAEWFAEAPSDPQLCRCRARAPEKEDISSKGSDTSLQFDPLASSRLEKHRMARKLLVKQLVPLSHVLPEKDPVTGQNVAELIATYRRAADQTCKLAVLAFITSSYVGRGRVDHRIGDDIV